MSRFGSNNNPITHTAMAGNIFNNNNNMQQTMQQQTKGGRRGIMSNHVCADGHYHSTESEVKQCIDAHRVYVCSENHMHGDSASSVRCDELQREKELLKDKELQRQHEREMMDKQIKLADSLRCMGWNFKQHGMPPIGWHNK